MDIELCCYLFELYYHIFIRRSYYLHTKLLLLLALYFDADASDILFLMRFTDSFHISLRA